jgi:PLP dependent protein
MTHSSQAEQLADRLHQIQQTLPESVKLIAVTKQVPVDLIRAAYALGLRDFGESRIQEAASKQAQLQDLTEINWHLIGHLQRNKAAKALELFQWIHSVDSLTLAQRLNQLVVTHGLAKPTICLQVKILPDPNKYGWDPAELLAHLPELNACTHLNIVGLMTIPPYELEPTDIRSVFQRTQGLAEEIRQQRWPNLALHHLSMGMSDDYPLAIEAGATMIRLGRTLFGER